MADETAATITAVDDSLRTKTKQLVSYADRLRGTGESHVARDTRTWPVLDSGDFSALRSSASKRLRQLEADREALCTDASEFTNAASTASGLTLQYKALHSYGVIAGIDVWQELQAQLTLQLQGHSVPQDKIETFIELVGSLSAAKHRNALKAQAKAVQQRAWVAVELTLGRIMDARLAGLVADLNQSTTPPVPTASAFAAAHDNLTTEMTAAVTAVQTSAADGDLPAAAAAAKTLRSVGVAAYPAALGRAAALNSAGLLRAADAITAADDVRLLMHLEATSLYVQAAAAFPDYTAPASAMIKAAARPTGQLPPDDSSATSAPDTITGLVTAVTITHEAGKAISSALVEIADSTDAVEMAIAGMKFDSCGAAVGTAIAASGKATQSISWLGGRSALVIGRRRLTVAATRSWMGWTYLTLLPIFEAWPHALTLRWSLRPGVNGAGNPLRYAVTRRIERSDYVGVR